MSKPRGQRVSRMFLWMHVTNSRSPAEMLVAVCFNAWKMDTMRRGRKHNIEALATQMQRIEHALNAIEADGAYVPPPYQMQALTVLRASTKHIAARLSDLEPTLWERVKKWQDTPYTASELRRRKALSFIGWWFAGFASIDYTIIGWFTPLFAEPWHRFIVSAAISLVFVIWMLWSDRKVLDK